jgi:hypothetical protein
MKVTLPLIILVSFFIFSCKKTEHQLRFLNNYALVMHHVQAGNVPLGEVNPGQTTAYSKIPEGDFSVSGNYANGNLEGSGTVHGRGKHQWTLTLNPDKTLTITENK